MTILLQGKYTPNVQYDHCYYSLCIFFWSWLAYIDFCPDETINKELGTPVLTDQTQRKEEKQKWAEFLQNP
jgi:hypothetical protein